MDTIFLEAFSFEVHIYFYFFQWMIFFILEVKIHEKKFKIEKEVYNQNFKLLAFCLLNKKCS